MLTGICAVIASIGLASCEDDPILSPQSKVKQSNGSYGNIAVAPPVDSAGIHSRPDAPTLRPDNPEVY